MKKINRFDVYSLISISAAIILEYIDHSSSHFFALWAVVFLCTSAIIDEIRTDND